MSIVRKEGFDPATSEALLTLIKELTKAISVGAFDKTQTENICGAITTALETAI